MSRYQMWADKRVEVDMSMYQMWADKEWGRV
jgi:hypothetical protein